MASWNSYDWDGDGRSGTSFSGNSQQRLPDSRAPRPRTDLAGDLDPTGPGNGLEVPDDFNASAVGLAGISPWGNRSDRAPAMETPMASPPPGLAGYANFRFAQGGSVPGAIDTDEEDNPMMDTMGSQLQSDINSALSIVKDVIGYGRKLHGLGGGGGGDDEGAVDTAQMPSTPFRETPVPQPMPKPNSFPYGPNEKPFGRRAGLEEKTLPSAPGQYTPTDRPMPKPNAFPYGPGQVPFGKRADAGEATETPEQEMAEGAIDTDEESA
jgi:hypothetical protein